MTASKKEVPKALTAEEKLDVIIDLLAANGWTLPKELRPVKSED